MSVFTSESGCKFGNKCSFPHRKVEEQSNTKAEKGWWQKCSGFSERCTTVGLRISGHRAAGIFIDFTRRAPESWDQFDEYDSQKLRSVMLTSERNKRPSLIKTHVELPHQRSPHAVKFEDRSQEETEKQERCARGDAWRRVETGQENILKLKRKGPKLPFFSPTNEWSLPAPVTIEPEERELVADSGASMHMVEQERPELSRIGNRESL